MGSNIHWDTQRIFSADDGLAADEIYDIYHDRTGRLWILTSGGLSIMTPTRGDPIVDGNVSVQPPAVSSQQPALEDDVLLNSQADG